MTNSNRCRFCPQIETLEGRALPSSLMTYPIQYQQTKTEPASMQIVEGQQPRSTNGIIAILIGL
jgi:hypothetical protein